MIALAQPAWLWLLPAMALPWIGQGYVRWQVASISLVPSDPLADWIDRALKSVASLAIGALLVLLAGPHVPETSITRSGHGAHTVILLDRSRSMDELFRTIDPVTRQPIIAYERSSIKSKKQVASEVLEEFIESRGQGRYGMTVFSTRPIRTLPITSNTEILNAAITAGRVGRGLAETNIGAALIGALDFYRDKPYTGSRNILLISDGGDVLSTPVRATIRGLLEQYRVSLFWIYIRTLNAVSIDSEEAFSPHVVLNRFFETLSTPYRLYTAERHQDLERAIDDVSRVQTQPILYQQIVPRRPAATWLYPLAAGLLGIYLALQLFTWRFGR